jgi:hypothetical protein
MIIGFLLPLKKYTHSMRHIIFILHLLFICCTQNAFSESRTIHVFVALCDNANQGIVPVPSSLGNGQDPKSNLYWGAAYGLKTFFKKSTSDWNLLQVLPANNAVILERLLFKHKTEDVYMLAEAYDGAKMETCLADYFASSRSNFNLSIKHEKIDLNFGGKADLIAFVGHNGLMDFDFTLGAPGAVSEPKDAIMLCCYSKAYFEEHLQKTNANPILWTTHLMAPEAYVLEAALKGWVLHETGAQIDERAAVAYDKFQHCGMRGARNLFCTGF